MPELPEVETVRRGLAPTMEGRRITRLDQRRPDLRFPLPERFSERLTGRLVERLDRRAKYLLAHLDGGEVLVMHLGMSGRFTVAQGVACSVGEERPSSARGEMAGAFHYDTGAEGTHDHVVFEMEGGGRVTYNDPRRFGFMDLVAADEMEGCKHFAGMGPEPLGNSFNAAYLASRAVGRAADLKAFLLDQRIIAGLGNIYVCEALFRARLSPNRAASCLADGRARPTERCERLIPVIRDVLCEAIASGGSTLRDYALTDGSLGYFQHSFKVYGREGEACVNQGCGGTIKRTIQGGRSSFHCGRCQR